MTIAVDFDGTIVEHRYPAIGKPVPFAVETLRALIEDGHRIILWTVREGQKLDDAVEFCRKNGVEFYAVNSEFPNASWSGSGVSRKIKADIYIDDSNLGGLPDWTEIYQMVSDKTLNRHRNITRHHKAHKLHKGPFTWLIRRCAEAREKFRK